MKRNQHGFGLIAILIITLVLAVTSAIGWFLWQNAHYRKPAQETPKTTTAPTSKSASEPKLVSKTFCSDVCPDFTRTFQVYEGITTQEACEVIDGQTILDVAWHGYIGCGERASGDPMVVYK